MHLDRHTLHFYLIVKVINQDQEQNKSLQLIPKPRAQT
jgi:hypothetical protein